MDLFNKLNMYIDYNNSYSIRKALNTLNREFNLAVKLKNQRYAIEIIGVARQLHDKMQDMSHLQLLMRNTRSFIAYLVQKSKSEFGTARVETEVN